MRPAARKEKSTGKQIRRRMIPALLLAAVILAWCLYTADYYRADAAALQAMESNDIRITRTSYGWYFDGPSETDALVFYPGGKVEETAYAPLLSLLAEKGIDVCLVKMPFHLAIFGANAAERVMKEHSFDKWYIHWVAQWRRHSRGSMTQTALFCWRPTRSDRWRNQCFCSTAPRTVSSTENASLRQRNTDL